MTAVSQNTNQAPAAGLNVEVIGLGAPLLIIMLSIIPVATTGLALTNSMHNIIWIVNETSAGLVYSDVTDHYWYNRIYAPFTYGLFALTAMLMIGRLPSIAIDTW